MRYTAHYRPTRLAGASRRAERRSPGALLTNAAVIAADQDPLGHAAREASTANGLDLLARPLSSGNVTVVLFNETGAAASVITTSAVSENAAL